jgi:predicted metal-binding protein
MTELPLEFLCKRALKLGARDAKIIKISSIKTGAWVRNKCQYGCSGFNESLTCPPYSPTPEQTQKVLVSFKKAILIHCDIRSKRDISDIVVNIEKEAFLSGFYKAWGMGAGPCRLCSDCNLKSGGCRHPEEARPSMEACGIDVYKTARNNGFTIEVLRSSHCKANYFGLVLIE